MTFKKRELLSLTAGLASTFAIGAAPAWAGKPIKLGYASWTDSEFVARLLAKLIGDNLRTPVELVRTDIALLFQGIARGDLDVMMMAWLPVTHADYWKRIEGKAERLGTFYKGRNGWVVPGYVPEAELSSIADLTKPEVRKKMGGIIQGIEPGAGLTRISLGALEAYGLDGYRLQEASELAMLSVVDRALRQERWVVATAWSPHWMFGKYDLRYLADPKKALGGEEESIALGRPGLSKDHPEVAAFLSRVQITLKDLEQGMLVSQEKDFDTAIGRFIDEHATTVQGWLAGA
ncbi:glycine betaine ABC transporter substrate-binding protein [Teichococcus oryzae]|uniref:Glycine betaine ABC transporter substrate-binding protein n=1 Tax=Teichococcus oryzae TaxID=1608942 RepID=A0A5B2TCK7_9PROT|nr:glycine betaine ABC transporter substrate-binding protein [Pseudoroseomonas oryzae]KAA2211814.1 glycine betaine ABC transporter substrate-binding protein [Pseudoroseomonas oryzae]